MEIGTLIGIWIAAALTLMIFSFLYKDNPVYKLGEHIFLGVSLGYTLCLYYWNSIYPQAIKPLFDPEVGEDPQYLVIIPIILALFILLRMIPKLAWLSRYSFALLIGGYAGMAVPNVIAGTFLPQIQNTMNPIGPDVSGAITQLVLLVGVFSTLIFFFFSFEHRGPVGVVSRTGILFIMVAFGAGFGYTVMARVSLLIGRFQFLLYEWLGNAMGVPIN